MWGFFSTKYSMIKHSASKEMDKNLLFAAQLRDFTRCRKKVLPRLLMAFRLRNGGKDRHCYDPPLF
jgi:hypothetical protein